MQQRKFGATGVQVAAVGQGTWNIERDRRPSAVAALRRGIDLGMTHIDTAEMYGSGRAEEIVAEAIAGRRDGLFIVSKVLPSNASRKGTIEACENSLKRLKTDRLDCYLLHWRGSYPLADTVAALETLQADGKVLSWGVSNFDVSDLDEVLAIAGPGKVACNQVLYHLRERAIEHGVIPWCEKHDVAVVAYSPFGQGDFPAPRSSGGKVLAEIANARGATPRQVALAFLIRHKGTFAIPKAASVEHVVENAGGDGLKLSAAEIAQIDRAFPRGARQGLPML
ncbi:MAG TPA: aldo/keto reductase [Alphaproteobacteria bacterium]|nr:aldo/keto reductase [Alphaproteobacteria bacterium]